MSGPVVVPTLDALVSDPSQVDGLPLEILKVLWTDVRNLEKVLVLRILMAPATAKNESPPALERWLTVEEAAKMFNVKPRWLRENKDRLPHSKPSHKVLLFPEQKLRSWLVAHKAN